MRQSNVILVDADGVLFDWEQGFDQFMQQQGFVKQPGGHNQYLMHLRYNCDAITAKLKIKQFNESPDIEWLMPLRDSVRYVRLLKSQGWEFHCITSLSNLSTAKDCRRRALDREFGPDIIKHLTCLDTGADKDHALEPYRNSGLWWVEDKPENADVGHALGLRSVLVDHAHNLNHVCTYPRVSTWHEIYQLITGSQT